MESKEQLFLDLPKPLTSGSDLDSVKRPKATRGKELKATRGVKPTFELMPYMIQSSDTESMVRLPEERKRMSSRRSSKGKDTARCNTGLLSGVEKLLVSSTNRV